MWTHLIPGLFVLWKTCRIYSLLQNPWDDVAYPLWIYSFGCCFVFFCSATAHLLNCYSVAAQELCFCLDYGSIAVFGLTLAISFKFLTCPVECFGFRAGSFPVPYTLLVFLLMLFSLHLTCRSRLPSCSKRYLYRFGPYAVSYCVAGFPCFMRYLSSEYPESVAYLGFSFSTSEQCYLGEDHSAKFLTHILFFFVAITFVFSRFPESIFPGTFDIVGHSHQWFHICVAYGMYLQHVMTVDALKDAQQLLQNKSLRKDEINFHFWSNVLPLFILMFLMLCMCVYYSRKTCKLLKAIRAGNE